MATRPGNTYLLLPRQMEVVRMARSDRPYGALLAAPPLCIAARRRSIGAFGVCPSALRYLSAIRGHGAALPRRSYPDHPLAAHALSSPCLPVHGADRGM